MVPPGQRCSGQVVLVTGAARGIGRACAQAFATAGARVVICDVDQTTAADTAQAMNENGHEVRACWLDVRDRAAWHRVVREIEGSWGPIEVLIGNAGLMPVGPVLDLSEASERQQMDVNVHGVIHGVHAVLPGMLERRRGSIVNIASLAGEIPAPYGAVYVATKYAVVGFTESLRYEMLDSGVHFMTVLPGFVQTELISGLQARRWPKPATPEDVAAATLDGVLRGKRKVYLPWYGKVLSLLPLILPHWLVVTLSNWAGARTMLKPVDLDARAQYRSRIREE